MQPPWFTKGKYRSDSNQHWREGCPHEELRDRRVRVAAAATHPEIWVYEGSTMGETMRAMLEQKQREWLEQLANDRIDLRDDDGPHHGSGRAGHRRAPARRCARTASATCGSSAPTCRSARSASISATPSISFRRGQTRAIADAVLEIVEREGVDVVLPQSSFDLPGLAAARDRFPVPVLVSSPDTVHRSNDKAETYELLQRIGVPTVEFRRVAGARAGRGGGARARLSRPAGLLQAGVLVRLARLPHPRSDGRPRAPAAARAARSVVDAAGGGARAASRRGRHGVARHGARNGRRAHDRRHRRRQARRARPREDARGDARRARDVLRHAAGRRPDGDRRQDRRARSRSSGSSTSSSSATA